MQATRLLRHASLARHLASGDLIYQRTGVGGGMVCTSGLGHASLGQGPHCHHLPHSRPAHTAAAFLSPDEQGTLSRACLLSLDRMARGYQDRHFDGVLSRYRERSVTAWAEVASSGATPGIPSDTTRNSGAPAILRPPARLSTLDREALGILDRARAQVRAWMRTGGTGPPLPEPLTLMAPHLLELEGGEASGIGPHVDYVESCGPMIAGLCLLSPAVMVFRNVKEPSDTFPLLLEPGSLYLQR